ncbi:ABC transporter ATP-binding protein [Pseudomonas putida]|uniref:ABC transporter ATP-binding protein n=1 Tax=Pseudomonas putida TaxID=303 RepID=UPI0023641B54|nr:ABC transporter ATP-binding protein [Pseudomonas putida]MDD2052070.1 ABC transporter ATP-binding protein [Pseudomonas putida]
MSSVTLNGIRKAFDGRVNAIEQLDLHIQDGEFFVLLGPSGCGKTTTLRCIAGLEEPDSGTLLLGQRAVADSRQGLFVAPEKRHIGMVFQNYALWPHLTVRQNVSYPLKVRGRLGTEQRQQVVQALELVGLHQHGERYPAELSGGQQQRVALARALVARPGLMLFDEPLSNMDAQLRIRLRQDLRRIHDELGYTAVYVTHDHAEALALADRIGVMNAGRLEQVGTPSEIFLTPRTRYVADFIGFENILAGHIDAARGERAQVALDGSDLAFTTANPAGLPSGTPVWLALRATQIAALPIDHVLPAQAQVLAGTIRHITYAGDRYLGEVDVQGQALAVTFALDTWGVSAPERGAVPGRSVHLLIQPEAALLLPVEAPAVAAVGAAA